MRDVEEIELVQNIDGIRSNILSYDRILHEEEEFQNRVSQVHSWYALKNSDGRWVFASSKFIGYDKLTFLEYISYYNKGLTGTDTEDTLKYWFEELETEGQQFSAMHEKLEQYLAPFGKKPRKKVRIYVVDQDRDAYNPNILSEPSEKLLDLLVEIAMTLPSKQLRELRSRIAA